MIPALSIRTRWLGNGDWPSFKCGSHLDINVSRQLQQQQQKRLLNKPYEIEVSLTHQNSLLKFSNFIQFENRLTSFIAESFRSVSQKAAKLLAVKVGLSTKSLPLQPFQPKCVQAWSARVWGRPGSNHSQSLTASNFAALWLTDLKVSASKNLIPRPRP